MAKNKSSDLIARVKIKNTGVINKYTINLEIGNGVRGWGLKDRGWGLKDGV